MPTLTVLSGLPGAGKTTRARVLAAEGHYVVGRDELRAMVARPITEPAVTLLAAASARQLLSVGLNVVVDGWNLTAGDQRLWEQLAAEAGVELVWLHLATPVEECVRRDASRPNAIGAAAVRAAAANHADRLAGPAA